MRWLRLGLGLFACEAAVIGGAALGLGLIIAACDLEPPSADKVEQNRQETILKDIAAKVGMPSVTNAREKKLLRDIIEKRDKADYVTYTYLFSEVSGKLIFFCESIGYPIPYATQFTNPQKAEWWSGGHVTVLPQADPNGLFSPPAADATWVLCKDPKSKKLEPIYVEPKLVSSPFPLDVAK